MAIVTNLLILYAGLVLINTALSAALWAKSRDPLHRALVFVWGSTLLSYVLQGALVQTPLVITYSFASAFLVNLALASLVARLSLDLPLRWQPFGMTLRSLRRCEHRASAFAGAPFALMALPVAVAVALPSLTVAARVIPSWRSLTVVTRALVVSCVAVQPPQHRLRISAGSTRHGDAGVHDRHVDHLRAVDHHARPWCSSASPRGRRASVPKWKPRAEFRRSCCPATCRFPGLEVMTYMRPAESVGGDYFDIHTTPAGSWLFLGDVTGHGLGAGWSR